MKKTSTQPRTSETRLHYYVGLRAGGFAAASPDNGRDLADRVWKYSSEEITELSTEAHKDLGIGARNQVSNRK